MQKRTKQRGVLLCTQQRNVAHFTDICDGHSPSPFHWSDDPDERKKLWKARHDALWAAYSLIPGATGFATDVCVPISRLADCIEDTIFDIEAAGLTAPIVGHVGDGNFHVAIQYDPKDKDSYKVIRKFSDKLIQKALDLEGTITGEHGVGIHKKEYLIKQHPDNLPYMKLIKKNFDPNNIMNPGKVFD